MFHMHIQRLLKGDKYFSVFGEFKPYTETKPGIIKAYKLKRFIKHSFMS